MKRLTLSALTGLSLLLATACAQQQSSVRFEIETKNPQQTIEHFGASDCWSMQHVGRWANDVQTQVADWLFSTENDAQGQPRGIGLSIWRFNVGGGSAEQGQESQIGSPWTRVECFLNADGTYDWNKQAGQRNFLRLAKERGVENFLAFLNSPPVHFTQNGLATNTGRDGTFNLRPECYDDFVRFLGDVVQGIEQKEGITFRYLCPFNEPDGHWNWIGPKQEGTPATNREIARTVRLLGQEFQKRNISTQILINESSDYRCMYATHPMCNWERGYEIQAFFSPDSTETYVGDVPNVPRMLAGHSYWTNTPLTDLRDIRVQLRDTLDKYNVGFWQTETCIMSNDEEIGGGGGYDRTMKTALYVARIIHHDLVYAQAGSWQWWRSVGGDYKDGLIREHSDRSLANGRVEDSKLLWAMGNYSRFVRPGAVRLPLSAYGKSNQAIPEGDTDQQGLMGSAYRNADGSLVLVMINYAQTDKSFAFATDTKTSGQWQQYRTSDVEGENLKPVTPVKAGSRVTIPPRAIVTFVHR